MRDLVFIGLGIEKPDSRRKEVTARYEIWSSPDSTSKSLTLEEKKSRPDTSLVFTRLGIEKPDSRRKEVTARYESGLHQTRHRKA
jgi:hypothetical protein